MPRLALVLCLVWFVSLFVVRTLVQWRRTGETGFKGFHGRPFSLEWIAGVCTSAGLLLAPLAPVGALLGWPLSTLSFESPALHGAGAALALLGTALAWLSQLDLGDSWRVGVDASEQTRLVTDGMFGVVRNPIFSFIGLSLLGLVLLLPTGLCLLAAVATGLGIELQVRHVEEPHLARTHGDDYARYAARVGRFVPGIGLLGSADDGAGPAAASRG